MKNSRLINKHFPILLFVVLFASIILSWMAIYNGFPLTFNNDTGMYIENAFQRYVASDRPMYYGLFIYVTSLNFTLWFVVFTQSLIVAYLIYLLFKYFVPHFHISVYLIVIVFLGLFTTVSFEVSWLMPDVFTAVLVISLSLLFFYDNLSKFDHYLLLIFVFYAIAVHNSHIFIGATIWLCLLTFKIFHAKDFFYHMQFVSYKRFSMIFLLMLFSYVGVGVGHYFVSGNFQSSRGGPVFLFSNLIEMGITNEYLDEYCDSKNYSICSCKDSLPNNFLWDEKSPIKKLGWEKNMPEYTMIIKDMLSKPKYLLMFVYRGVIYTGKQYSNFDAIDISPPAERISKAVKHYFPHEYKGLKDSKQNKNLFSLGFLNFMQEVFFAIATFYYVVWHRSIDPKLRIILLTFLSALIINAIICSVLSGVYPRYQARLIWIYFLPLLLHCSNQFITKRILTN